MRRAVATLAGAALVAGTAMLLHVPLTPPVRGALVVAWLAAGVHEIGALARGAARVTALGIDADGAFYGRGRDGRRVTLELLPGSVVGTRLAWLHLRFPGGERYGELLRGRLEEPAWRRLRVCWRCP